MAAETRQQLIDYCLRSLGAPVLEINVDDDQLSDRVDEALAFYQEFHSDAVLDTYQKYQLDAIDIVNEYIPINADVSVVKRIVPLSASVAGSSNMFDINYQMALSDVYNLRGGVANVSYYSQIQSHYNLMSSVFSQADQVKFSRHMNRLQIFADWGTDLVAGDWIIMENTVIIDPDTFSDVFNDTYLKRYTTALIKRQWGANLKKFEGMQLPGGVTFSGQALFDEALAEIATLEEQIRLVWEKPVDFFVG